MGDVEPAVNEPPDETPSLCGRCLSENPPGADFCQECGRPLTMFATVDPIKSIWSRGWAWRQAAWGRSVSLTVLIGMWLLFGPVAVACIVATVANIGDGSDGVPIALGGLALSILPALLLYRVTRHYVRHRHRDGPEAPENE